MQAPLQARNDSDAAQTDTARTVAQKPVLADNRLEAVAQRKLAEMMNNSPRVLQQRALSDAIHKTPRMVAQRHDINTFPRGAVKAQGDGAIPVEASSAQREGKANNTGLPDQLKSGIESLSGMSMDHVKVHYNSGKPTQLQAHAYAQGSEIYLGTGQERHLPHEAWHVVQQAQGRVRPTLQMKAGAINDDPSLEKEADMMGGKAAHFKHDPDVRNLMAEDRMRDIVTQRLTGPVLHAPVQLARVNIRQNGAEAGTISGVSQFPSRPSSNARGGQGNHLTAYVVFEDTIVTKVINRTPEGAAASLQEYLNQILLLPGMQGSHASYLRNAIENCRRELNDPDNVNAQIDVILTIRNQVPGSAIQGNGGP
jgi:hypothetical protein